MAQIKTTKNKAFALHKKLKSIGIFIIIYAVSLFVPFISPFTRYPLYIVKCLGLPIEGSTFAAGNSYTVPGSRAYKIDIFSDRYFCTEEDAKRAFFRKYDF